MELELFNDYWAFSSAHPVRPCLECARQAKRELDHWIKISMSDSKYAYCRAEIQRLLKEASPIDMDRLCIEHIQKMKDIYDLRDWYIQHCPSQVSGLVDLAYFDRLQALWNKSKK